MSWYAPGTGSGISFNPFQGVSNGGNGGTEPMSEPLDAVDQYNNSTGTSNAQDSEPQPTLSQYMSEHPDLSPEEYMAYMAQHSEEWAEKYLDYLAEKGELDRANSYTANREDTAYQRLVQDLRNAGLNPAMMYGGSASISAGGSQGYIKMTEGANSRAVGNYSKIQKILLAYMMYELQKNLGTANTIFKGIGSLGSLLGAVL